MAIYATWDDVKAMYELPMPDGDEARVTALLTQASARLTALVPSLPARLTAETLDPELPRGLVVEAVLRVYRNPSGVTQQATGPFSRSLHATAARNEIYFDPEAVRALLVEANDSTGVGTFTVSVPAPQGLARPLDVDPAGYYSPEQLRVLWGRW